MSYLLALLFGFTAVGLGNHYAFKIWKVDMLEIPFLRFIGGMLILYIGILLMDAAFEVEKAYREGNSVEVIVDERRTQ